MEKDNKNWKDCWLKSLLDNSAGDNTEINIPDGYEATINDNKVVFQKKVPELTIEHGKTYVCVQDFYSGGNKRASVGDVVIAKRGMSIMSLGKDAGVYFREWTISDAKSGDILVVYKDNHCPFIFSGKFDSYNHPIAVCGLNYAGDLLMSCEYDNGWTTGECGLADDEQKEMLFEKLAENSYMYNESTKTLSRVLWSVLMENNSTSNISETKYWTLNDAKPGDILTSTETNYPFIFNGLLDPNNGNKPCAFCGLDCDGDFCKTDSGEHFWTDKEVYPATKEQKDMLFQKMNEAGYRWNFVKLELEEI